ncbi:MAG: PD-(D/E)XK nuclease family protein [Clostridia bacterium]|nr:PD-(D/E)XK nuclease family protein [Clostridia bacterium]
MTAVLSAYTLSECMDVMAEYAAAYESQGGRNVIFCEDRLTLIAERALVKKTGGTFFSSVTTFARFLKTDVKVLTKQGSVMATGSIMESLAKEKKLLCFTTSESVKNAAKSVYETMAQLAASEISPASLQEGAAELEEGNLKGKVLDLAKIYEGYGKFLKENGYVDESGYLSLLPAYIRSEKSLKGANVFFLCFGSFTAQAAETIKACADVAANVIGIFCAGEEELYTGRARSVFMRACEERVGAGRVRMRNLGIPLLGEAEVFRKGLFDPERLALDRFKTDKIRFFEAEDKNGEAELVAASIKKLIAENSGMRYRDVAVLSGDPKAYALPLKKAFDEYGIPFFLDEKKSLKRHPLGQFLLGIFAVVREGFSSSSVQALAQNVFFGESDEYRNYLLKFANYRGGAKKEIKTGPLVEGYDQAALLQGRERLLLATKDVKGRGHGRDYCCAVRNVLKNFKAEAKLKEIEEGVEDVAIVSYLSQILPAMKKILAEAELLTADKEMSAAEFEALLSGGLDATDISLIPLKADAVFVGDIADSRIEKVRALFAVGMTDAVPRTTDDTALISDKEIERLAEVKTMLEPTVAEVNLRSRECVALNLCTFEDALFLSYPLSANGEEPALSEIFRYASGLFSTSAGEDIPIEKGLSEADFKYVCSALVPGIRRLLLEKNEYDRQGGDTRRHFYSLYAALERASYKEQEDYLNAESGLVRIKKGEKLFFSEGRVSPTALEKYFSCPFGNFAAQGLKLREREEASVLATDSGNFVHALLERMGKKFDELKTEAEARAFAEETGRELLASPLFAAQSDTAAGKYAAENLLFEGVEAATAAYLQLQCSDYRVEETEKSVRTEYFRGKVDRVDVTDDYVRVIDYKTGRIDDKPIYYYTGRKMQLQLYMSAVMGERTPAGVFYFPASVSYRKPDEASFRMTGYLNGDRAAIEAGDKTLVEGEKSRFFDARLDDNARLEKVMDEETFRDFLDYAIYEARQGTKEMKRGFIAPAPYEGGCAYCPYGGMCGFNYDLAPARKEENISPKEIASIARRHREGTTLPVDVGANGAEEQKKTDGGEE